MKCFQCPQVTQIHFSFSQETAYKTDLTSVETKSPQKPSTSFSEILHHDSLYVDLELKEVNILPVGAVQSEDVPSLAHLIGQF